MKVAEFSFASFLAGAAVALGVAAPSALAHDGTSSSPDGIVGSSFTIDPSGSNDDAFNGYRVFLSSPRHSNSGDRGECMNPGRQENVNGRRWNWYAANGNWVLANNNPASRIRNIHARGYKVRVSANSKDDGFADNKVNSQNWGSDVHIITHTNAIDGCQEGYDYLLLMWEHANDENLCDALRPNLNSYIPGPSNQWQDTGWLELETNAGNGDCYVELQFHSNQQRQTWIYGETIHHSYLYGVSIDQRLGYP